MAVVQHKFQGVKMDCKTRKSSKKKLQTQESLLIRYLAYSETCYRERSHDNLYSLRVYCGMTSIGLYVGDRWPPPESKTHTTDILSLAIHFIYLNASCKTMRVQTKLWNAIINQLLRVL